MERMEVPNLLTSMTESVDLMLAARRPKYVVEVVITPEESVSPGCSPIWSSFDVSFDTRAELWRQVEAILQEYPKHHALVPPLPDGID